MVLRGRKYLGLNEDGSYKLSKWQRLGTWEAEWDFPDTHFGDQNFNVPRKYVELGFEFSIAKGSSLPYSDKFRSADLNNRIDKVEIGFGGGSFTPTFLIKVNGNTLLDKPLYGNYTQYPW